MLFRSNTPQKSLPDGWRLVVTGSTGWDALRRNEDGSVTLSTGTGVSVTYTKSGLDQWEPQIGGFNIAGETTMLAENADGTFSATDGNRVVTVFSKPTVDVLGRPVRVWAQDSPAPQQRWSEGLLRSLTDPVTSNPIVFLYSGDKGCADKVDPRFVQAPAGMLCGTIDATGGVVVHRGGETARGDVAVYDFNARVITMSGNVHLTRAGVESDRVATTGMDTFRRRVAATRPELVDTVALHRWSIEHQGEFHEALWDFAGVIGEPGSVAFDAGDGSVRGGRFFPQRSEEHTSELQSH